MTDLFNVQRLHLCDDMGRQPLALAPPLSLFPAFSVSSLPTALLGIQPCLWAERPEKLREADVGTGCGAV